MPTGAVLDHRFDERLVSREAAPHLERSVRERSCEGLDKPE